MTINGFFGKAKLKPLKPFVESMRNLYRKAVVAGCRNETVMIVFRPLGPDRGSDSKADELPSRGRVL